MLIKIPKHWEIPEREATPEVTYLSRRRFLREMGVTGILGFGLLSGCVKISGEGPVVKPLSEWTLSDAEKTAYPSPRNNAFDLDRPLTEEAVAAQYNNFYEFSSDKDNVWKKAKRFTVRPWTVEVTGLVKNPRTLDIDELIRSMPIEERIYRLRCVEAWAMAVPWTGFPMRALLKSVQPLSSARYVRMVSFLRPEEAGGQTRRRLPWPYTEALTIEEANNELTLLVTGIYGHPLPKQHGAPIRLIVPWKYGFKSIKSIVRIEFTDERPATFWNTLVPFEYHFEANVNPKIPHPRWSQATERMIGTGRRFDTLLYNGYQDYVQHLYA